MLDKHATKAALAAAGIPTSPTLAVLADRSALAQFDLDALPDAWALKPNSSRCGLGIVIAAGRRGAAWLDATGRILTPDAVRRHVRSVLDGEFSPDGERDAALFEPLLRPNAELAAIAPLGLPDVRILCDGARPVMAMLRLPTRRSGARANLHRGAVGAAVDLETGRITGARIARREIEHHPDTGVRLLGVRVPRWQDVLAAAAACHGCTGLGYLGADVVVAETHGVLVLEVNASPGLEIQNVNGCGLGDRMRCP